MLSNKSFKTYLHRVLTQVHPELNITKSAIDCTDSILRTVATQIATDAHLFTQGTEKKTLSAREVQSAVLSVLPAELAKKSVSESTKAVMKYSSSIESTPAPQPNVVTKPIMRETRAGIKFSVSLLEKYLRGFGQIKYNVSASAPVYLAATIEYIAYELLELAGNNCRENKRMNITVRHLYLALTSDNELDELISKLKIVILGGGVQPNINERLLKKKKVNRKKTKKTDDNNSEEKKHRWRPGTVALREIRHYQKTYELLMQRAPFERLVRIVGKESHEKIRFTHQFMEVFQHLIEHDTIEMLKTAIELCCHANRETVQITDIDLASKLSYSKIKGGSETVPTAAVSKLAYRAGIKRMGDDAKNRVKAFITGMISHYMKYVLLCTDHNRRQTINTKFLLEGLAMAGIYLATIPEKRKAAKASKGTTEGNSKEESDVESVYSPSKEEVKDEVDDDGGDEDSTENKPVAKGETEEEDEETILDDIEESDEDELTDEE